MVVTKYWCLKTKFNGTPTAENFELKEENIPDTLQDGDVLTEAVNWTVDPYMRTAELGTKEGDPMGGGQVAKVIASKNDKFPVGTVVLGQSGWRTVTLAKDGKDLNVVPDISAHGLPLSLYLGCLGMPGVTAYFGFLEVCQPKEGETVLVNGAAGAVGSLVGQIAKIKGCKVVAYAGSDAKCKWLKEELKFDHVFNYKSVDLDKSLTEAAPEGIDCYFDNVGGDFTVTALKHMKTYGRVSICGSISGYNATAPITGELSFMTILMKQLKVEGFIVVRWLSRWQEAVKAMSGFVTEGKLKYKETVTKGFENMPNAFIGLFKGENIGKAIVSS